MSGDTLNQIGRVLTPVLLDVGAKGMVLLLAGLGATLLMRKASAAARHLVWGLCVIGLLLLPILSLALPGWHVLPPWLAVQDAAVPTAPSEVPTPPVPSKLVVVPAPTASEQASPVPARMPLSVGGWIAVLWAAGTVLALLPLILGNLMLLRLRSSSERITSGCWPVLLREQSQRLGLGRPVRLLHSRQRSMPMTWGVLRTMMVVPAESEQWSLDRRRVVLFHELGHVKRHDGLWQLLTQIACAAYWFNPLVWVALRQMRNERERACDDLVISTGTKGSAYAEQLLEIASSLQSHPLAAYSAIAMARSGKLESRLLAILDSNRNRTAMSRAGVILAVVLVAMVAAGVAVLRAQPQDNASAGAPATQPDHTGWPKPTDPTPVPPLTLDQVLDAVQASAEQRDTIRQIIDQHQEAWQAWWAKHRDELVALRQQGRQAAEAKDQEAYDQVTAKVLDTTHGMPLVQTTHQAIQRVLSAQQQEKLQALEKQRDPKRQPPWLPNALAWENGPHGVKTRGEIEKALGQPSQPVEACAACHVPYLRFAPAGEARPVTRPAATQPDARDH